MVLVKCEVMHMHTLSMKVLFARVTLPCTVNS